MSKNQRTCLCSSGLRILLGVLAFSLPSAASAQSSYAYRITDPMVGTSLADLNTAYWEPWSAPSATGAPAISNEGFTLSGHQNYLGLMGAAGGPVAKWLLQGDFHISIRLAQGSSTTRRNQASLYEVVDCATLGANAYGVWGGAGAEVGNTPGDHYPMPAGETAYYLFSKQGAGLTIHEGNASAVSAADPIVLQVTLPNPDASYLFYLGTGSPNDNTMTASDLVIETQGLASCPGGAAIPEQWKTGGACTCSCQGQGSVQTGQGYRITDPMVGTSLADLNTAYWEPWSAPSATGAPAISSEGFTLSGQQNYLGLMGAAGGPVAKWLLQGDFRISIRLAQGSSTTRRNQASLYEVVDCATLGANAYGVWGGAGAEVGNVPGDHYPMPAGGTAYYLFSKQAASLTIHEGSASGVGEADPIVLGVTLPNPAAGYIFYLGTGSPNDNTMTASNLVLESQGLASCPAGISAPASWCDCGCAVGGGPQGGDGGGGGCSMGGRGDPADSLVLMAFVAGLGLALRRTLVP